jgi:hypothetical protein
MRLVITWRRREQNDDLPLAYNGPAEWFNRTCVEKVHAMLHASGLPKFLWAEAVKHANYLRNRTSTRALEGMAPFEVRYGRKPNLAGLREWLAKVWVHDSGTKLDARGRVERWVGYDGESNAHRIYWDSYNPFGTRGCRKTPEFWLQAPTFGIPIYEFSLLQSAPVLHLLRRTYPPVYHHSSLHISLKK